MKHYPAAAAAILAAAAALLVLPAALGRAASGPAFGRVHHLQEVAKQRAFTNEEVDQLTHLASDKDWMVRCRALTALRHVSTPEQKAKAVEIMRKALSDPAEVVRAYAASGLGVVGDTAVIPALNSLLNDPQPGIRNTAYRAIGKLYLAASQADQAIRSYEAAARVPDLGPESLDPTARDLVAACRRAGRPSEAVTFVQSLLAGDPTNRSYMHMLAIADGAAGQPDKAAEWQRKSELVGNPAPAIRLKDLEGKEQTLGAYRGQLVLLNFFASW